MSITPLRGSSTTTSRPARAAYSAVTSPTGSAAGHHQVAHQAPTPASAVFSTRSRTVSSTALSSVNTSAVTQAACTSGSATPSTTTAT